MFIRKYWLPVTVFLVAIVGVGLYYLQTRLPKDPIVIIKPVEPLPKSEVAEVVEGDTSQGGHFHADGTWHDGRHEATVEPPSTDVGETPAPVTPPTRTGPLTYHAELLASHPVEALRAQAEERGHWSAQWIPPFPSDNHEATALARTAYHIVYYRSTGETDTPKAEQNGEEYDLLLDTVMDKGLGPRRSDLLKLTWTILPSSSIDTTFIRLSNFDLPLR